MEQQHISKGSLSDELPPQHSKYPWLVAQNLEAENEDQEQIFYTINPLSEYRCRIPELIGKRIRACFHGWVILSEHPKHIIWSLWNPLTSNIIRLPPLIHEEGDTLQYECCLSSPPEDPSSILLLTTLEKTTFIFCRLDCKRNNLEWTEISYAKQLRSITGGDNCLLHSLTYSNGKIYVLSTNEKFVIHVDFAVTEKTVAIKLLPIVRFPPQPEREYSCKCPYLKGSCAELFFIYVCKKGKKIVSVCLFKLDTTSMLWEKLEDLKDTMFFVGFTRDYSVIHSPAVHSELGGYIHILDKMDKVIYSYDVKKKTVAMCPMPHLDLPLKLGELRTSYAVWSMPECRLQGDYGETKCSDKSKQEEDKEYGIEVTNELEMKFPFHILEMIMDFCVDVDYLNFRLTCKQFASLPVIRWSNITTIPRLKKYSLVSPWSMVIDKDRGFIMITDPMLGDKYYLRTPQQFTGELQIHCSRYGWLLMSKNTTDIMFYNPFTGDIHKLPNLDFHYIETFSFSAPPTSSKCTVVGLTRIGECPIYIHSVSRDQSWRRLQLFFDNYSLGSFRFPTFFGRDIYVLNSGGLDVFKHKENRDENGNYEWGIAVFHNPNEIGYDRPSTKYYLTKSDQRLLLVFVDEFEKYVEVYKLNRYPNEWKKLDSLGRYTIYVCDTTCLCFEAKTSKMENIIYFHHSYSENNKSVFYSLETREFHTFNDDMERSLWDLFKLKHLLMPHAWIEPSCL